MDNKIIDEYISETLKVMEHSGVFLVSGNNPPNLLTLGLGTFGNIWDKPVIVIPVRYTRYTYDLIDKYHEFTISVPRKDLSSALIRCDQISGRDADKFKELNLHPTRAKMIDTYIVADCGLHLECRVLYKAGMEGFNIIDEKIKNQFYTTKNYHTMFFSEIVAAYTTV